MTRRSSPSKTPPFFTLVTLTMWWLRAAKCQTGNQQFNMVIAQDGTGDFTTITQGLAALSAHLQTASFSGPSYVRIAAGVYNEYVVIGQQHRNLVFVGDGMESTIITGTKSHADGLETHETATVVVNGDGFVARDMTFRNAIGPENAQAVALLTASTGSVFYRCKIISFQDTLYVKDGVQFFRECDIYGTVDFIFGAGKAVFQSCNMFSLQPLQGQSNTVTAQGRSSATADGGFVLHNCTITVPPELQAQAGSDQSSSITTFLGRPWKDFAVTVVMQSFLDASVAPQGWLQWDDETPSLGTIYYAEYGNRGPGSATNGRVNWKGFRVIGSAEASQFTVRRFIDGDSWIPSTGIPYFPDLVDDGFGGATNYLPGYLYGDGFGFASQITSNLFNTVSVLVFSIWMIL